MSINSVMYQRNSTGQISKFKPGQEVQVMKNPKMKKTVDPFLDTDSSSPKNRMIITGMFSKLGRKWLEG